MTAADWVSVAEAACRLDIDPHTLYAAVNAGTVPARRIGRSVRVPAAWVDAAGASANGHTPPLDIDELADAVADRLVARLVRLLVGAVRATAPGEPGAVLDLARDERFGHDHRTG
jgi:excisionase family DNA binding protein